ncbi:MAG TPA: rhomboid family intramembrane serine protease [Blastocatellia bacterium]|nr:rhomboid family intramembrane serine protease [Blastocatellia bacterium]
MVIPILIILFIIFLMVFFVPYGNDGTVWRTPWITFSIIVINVAIYIGTCTTMDRDYNRLEIAGQAVSTYLEDHPELIDSQRLDELYAAHIMTEGEVAYWRDRLEHYHRGAADLARYSDEYSYYQALLKDFTAIWDNRFDLKWGYVPAHPSFVTMITSMFLHGGLMHLFGNMFFLFALGFSLEDLWGRWLFAGFYLVSGIVAVISHHVFFSSSTIPEIGASGAIAGVMGAYLIRLARTRIKFTGFWILHAVCRIRMLLVPAYVFLPIWFLWELDDATSVAAAGSGVAHWAHVGGFAFGMVFAFGLRLSTLEERFIKPSIEAKIDFTDSRAVTEALESMEKGDVDRAAMLLDKYLFANPSDINGLMANIQVYQLKQDIEGARKAQARMIHQCLRTEDHESAINTYDALLSSYTEDNPPLPLEIRDWMAICEHLDKTGLHQIAAVEYRRAGRALKNNGFAVKALLNAAEIFLDKVGNNKEAAISFLEAKALNPTQPQWIERVQAGIEKIKELELAKRGITYSAQNTNIQEPEYPQLAHSETQPGTSPVA